MSRSARSPGGLILPRREFLRLSAGLGLGALSGLSALNLAGCKGKTDSLGGGPYVLNVRPDAAVVGAITDSPQQLTLRWGLVNGSLDGVAAETSPSLVHGLEATGLRPGARYRYVLDGFGESTFTTAPERDAPRVTFCAFGDSGGTKTSRGKLLDDAGEVMNDIEGVSGDTDQQGKVASALASMSRPDFVLHTGDVVYPDGAPENYREGYFGPFGSLIATTPVYATLGNHDVKTGNGSPLLERFQPPKNGFDGEGRTYSFDWGPVHVVCIDVMSSDYAEGSPQMKWLERDLAATDRPWKVAMFHAPAYGASRHGDSETIQQSVVPVLARGKVDLVLSGHDHIYARFFPTSGPTYVVTGGGGQSLDPVKSDDRLAYAESVFHYVEVVAERSSMRLTAIDARGRPFDAATLRKA